METTPAVGLGLDLIIPQFVAMLLKQSGFDKRVNTLIVLLVYVGWAAVSTVIGVRGMPHGTLEQTVSSVITVLPLSLAAGYAAYTTVWKNLLGEETLTAKTSIIKGPEEDPVILEDIPAGVEG
jgi:hypothetical protein